MHARLLLSLVAVIALASCGPSEPAAERSPDVQDGSVEGPGPAAGKTERGSSAPKDPAPDFSFTTFEGDTFALGERRGTPIVLNFWESW